MLVATGIGDCWSWKTPCPLLWGGTLCREMLFRALGGACGVCGALSTSSTVLTEAERWRVGGFVGGSGLMTTDSLGVETAEGADLLAVAVRDVNSTSSGLSAMLIIFLLGCVPSGAMFCTTPCLSIPASTKLARGGGRGGSTHLSRKVLVSAGSATEFFASASEFEAPGTKGLAIRDLVGRGVGVEDIVARLRLLRPPPFLCDRESSQAGFSESGKLLVQGQTMERLDSLLLDASTACTPAGIAIRGGGRGAELVRKWRWGALLEGEKVSLRGSLTEPPKALCRYEVRYAPALGSSHAKKKNSRPHTEPGKSGKCRVQRAKFPAVACSGEHASIL